MEKTYTHILLGVPSKFIRRVVESGGHGPWSDEVAQMSYDYLYEEQLSLYGNTDVAKRVTDEKFSQKQALDRRYYSQEIQRQDDMVVSWVVRVDQNGEAKLYNEEYGEYLDNILDKTRRYAEDTGDNKWYNPEENTALLTMQRLLISGEASAVAYPTHHPDGIRYIPLMKWSEDGTHITSTHVDIAKFFGHDIDPSEASLIINRLQERFDSASQAKDAEYPYLTFTDASITATQIREEARILALQKALEREIPRVFPQEQTVDYRFGGEWKKESLPPLPLPILTTPSVPSKVSAPERQTFLPESPRTIDQRVSTVENVPQGQRSILEMYKRIFKMPLSVSLPVPEAPFPVLQKKDIEERREKRNEQSKEQHSEVLVEQVMPLVLEILDQEKEAPDVNKRGKEQEKIQISTQQIEEFINVNAPIIEQRYQYLEGLVELSSTVQEEGGVLPIIALLEMQRGIEPLLISSLPYEPLQPENKEPVIDTESIDLLVEGFIQQENILIHIHEQSILLSTYAQIIQEAPTLAGGMLFLLDSVSSQTDALVFFESQEQGIFSDKTVKAYEEIQFITAFVEYLQGKKEPMQFSEEKDANNESLQHIPSQEVLQFHVFLRVFFLLEEIKLLLSKAKVEIVETESSSLLLAIIYYLDIIKEQGNPTNPYVSPTPLKPVLPIPPTAIIYAFVA